MNRTLFSALFGAVVLVLTGCGASVDGGSGVFKNEADISVTSSFDKPTVIPGTNLMQSVTVTNNGPRHARDFEIIFTDSGNPTDGGWPILTFEPFELQTECTLTGEGELGDPQVIFNDEYPDGAIVVDASLDYQSSADCELRLPVMYTSAFIDTVSPVASATICATEDADNADPDTGNNCSTNSADVGDAPSIVDFRDEIIYWALTDRFFNGDTANDNLPGTRLGDEADPSNLLGWHGGDWAGLKQKIEEGYFQSLGFTTIWISPVVYQQPAFFGQAAYHGYWLDNYDDPEPHFGTWQELSDLVTAATDNDLKIIIDLVVNHSGYDSVFPDLMPEWFRQNAPACGDNTDEVTCAVAGLPDVRQEVAEARDWVTQGASNVLIQSGASGYRIDTFKHVNRDYWSDFFAPGAVGDRSTVFSIGETFSSSVSDIVRDLDWLGSPSVFDFPLYGAMRDAMARATASMETVAAIFSSDSEYADPTRLTTFLDNHDVDRFMTEAITNGAGEAQAEERLDMALGLLYGARGIPQVYYGTELAYQGTVAGASNRASMTFPNGALARLASLKGQPGLAQKASCGVAGTGDPSETYGVPFYVRGGFNDWGAPPEAQFQNLGVIFGSSRYEAEFEVSAGTYEFKVASEDWSTVDFTADGPIELFDVVPLVPGSGASNTTIVIQEDGCYNFVFTFSDPDTPELQVTKVPIAKATCGVEGTGDPSEAYGVPFFARGGFNDWGNPPESLFNNMGNNVYEAEFPIAAGSYEFKVASEDWSTVDFTADGLIGLDEYVALVPGSGASNTSIDISEDGCFNLRLDVSDPDAPVLRVAQVIIAKPNCGVEGTGDPSEAYGVPFYVRGGFNDWGAPPAAQFQNMGNNNYQAEFEVSAGPYEFKVASEDWSTVDFTANGEVFLDLTYFLVPGSGASNSSITLKADACYNFSLDVTDPDAPVLVVSDANVLPSEREVDLFARLGKLAAARKAYPALARGTQDVIYSPAQGCAEPDSGNDPAEAFGVEMFARGGFNGWAAPDGDSFVNLGGGIYRAQVQLPADSQSYKVAAGDWSVEYADAEKPTPLDTEVTMVVAAGPGTDGAVEAGLGGCYTWTMDANDTEAPTLTISLLEVGDPTDVMAIQRDLEDAASVVVVVNNEDGEVDLSTLGGGIPVGFADGSVIEITGAETDLTVSGGLLIGTMPARTSYLVSDQ